MSYSLRLAFLIDIPAAVGLYLLALPIVSVLFQRGEFTQATATATAGALVFFALKIPFVSGVRNLVPGFFALRDAKTPVIISAVAVAVNAGAALVLMHPLLHRGLAAALVISSAANFFLLLWFFRRKVGPIGARRILASVGKTCVASAIMGVVLIGALQVTESWPSGNTWQRAGVLCALVVLGAAVFIGATRLINPEEYRALAGLVRRRRKRGTPPTASNGLTGQSA